MLLHITRWLKGYVQFSARGKYTERFINLLNKKQIPVWDLSPHKNSLRGKMFISDYAKIRKICKKANVVTKVDKKCGLFIKYRKYSIRTGLLIGAVLFYIIISFLQSFIWSIEINGNNRISNSEIETALNQCGLPLGIYAKNINTDSIERKLSLKLTDIRWVAINITGSNATIEIKEKAKKPKIYNTSTPANIKAKCDGIILKTDVKEGTGIVKKGYGVSQGQLLVSGIVSLVDTQGKTTDTLVRANAEIIAKTTHKSTYTVNQKYTSIVPTDEIISRNYLSFFNMNIPLTFYHLKKGQYIRDTRNNYLYINNVYLPIGSYRENNTLCVEQKYSLKEKRAMEILKEKKLLDIAFKYKDINILEEQDKINLINEKYTMSTTYVCREDIAKQIDIIVQ